MRVVAGVVLMLLLFSSGPRSDEEKRGLRAGSDGLPPELYSKVRDRFVARVGKCFFDEYVDLRWVSVFDTVDTCITYRLEWEVHFPNLDQRVGFGGHVGSCGDRIMFFNRLPNCAQYPSLCEVSVTRARAIAIARSAGMADGIEPWNVQFRIGPGQIREGDPGGFRWWVMNTLSRNGDDRLSRTMVIAANDSLILRDWKGWWREQ